MERKITIAQFAHACSSTAENCDDSIIVSDIVTDSRKIVENSIFIALRGEKFDGHNFVAQAIKNGAVAAVVDGQFENEENLPIIRTKDTLKAFGAMAAYYRNQFQIPSVAITGSVGKTSTKEMVSAVLKRHYNTLKTDGNFNNEIGLPLTVLRMENEHEIAVFEMGMSNFGEISALSKIAAPETAILTNIGYSHIEFLKSQENILKAKLEIVDGLMQDGTIILNGDDPYLAKAAENLPFETLTYGVENENCDVRAVNIKKFASGTEFDFLLGGEEYHVSISVPGIHHVYNALAAILTGIKYNIPVPEIIAGIKDFEPVGMRQKVENLKNCVVIRDCYNASPTSMKSGLEVLNVTAPVDDEREFRRVAIMGDMLELGDYSREAHEEVGGLTCDYDLGCLIAVGKNAEHVARGAIEKGFNSSEIYVFYDTNTAKAHIEEILRRNDVILLKGSRGMHLEEIADFIEEIDERLS